MAEMKILLTGGSGRLGTELQKCMKLDAPSHNQLDITGEIKKGEYDLVIHAAGYTDVRKAEYEGKDDCYKVNVFGTRNMVQTYWNVPFVYISSEYAKFPEINYYSSTKAEGEQVVKDNCLSYLIIRTTFKPRPYPYDRAWADQYTQGDYVDVIAKLIAEEIKNWHTVSKMIYVGTGRKTIYELAKQTRPDVKKAYLIGLSDLRIPPDYI